MGDSVAEIEGYLREAINFAPIVEGFLPPQIATGVQLGVAAEPVIEQVIGLVANLVNQGADHSGAVASVGAILGNLGDLLTKRAVLSPPPVVATARPAEGVAS